MTATVAERVARGAALLDEKVPGWRERINLDTFAISSCERCILGQVYGYYATGLGELRRPRSDPYSKAADLFAVSHGFMYSRHREVGELGDAWRAELATC